MDIQLSVVILTDNDQQHVGECLDSVKAIADEIVVVDSYSADRTGEICKSYGALFIQHAFRDHVDQKNWALDQTSFPYVLFLNANEFLSESLASSISEVKKAWKYDAYQFNAVTKYCGKWIRHAGLFSGPLLRLWDSRKGSWNGISPYDEIVLEPGTTKKILQGDLFRYSHDTLEEHLEEINVNSSIAAEHLFRLRRKTRRLDYTIKPFIYFFREYLFKLGFLEGFHALQMIANAAYERFQTNVKLKNLLHVQREQQKQTICFFNSNRAWGGGEKYHLEYSLRLYRSEYPVIIFTNSQGELRRRVAETGMPYFPIRISNLSFLNPFKILRIARILRQEKVRVLLMNLSADLKAAGIAARIAGVKRIIYRRGSAIPVRNTFLNRFLFRRILDEILANSYETKRTLLKNNPRLIHPSKIRVIYNGLDFAQFESTGSKPCYYPKGGEVILGNAGRLVRQKAQEYLVDLAVELDKRKQKFKILIAGEGPLEKQLLEYSRTCGVEDKIIFLGFIKDMNSFMEAVDIFVLTSRWEGFGYVIVEAMAHGRPVIAFDVSSNPEIIEDGKSGYLVPTYDIGNLSDRVEQLMVETDLRKDMGNYAKLSAYQRFNINQIYKKVEEFLMER